MRVFQVVKPLIKLGKGLNPSHSPVWLHLTATEGIFRASVAAGKLTELNDIEIADVVGIVDVVALGMM